MGVMKKRWWRDLGLGLAFLSPNIAGVLLFVVFPVVASIAMAFTNWDLKQHNMWKDASPKFVGLDNFVRLFQEPEFLRFFGNTLFLMMGIPLGIGAALISALLLNQDTRGNGPVRKGLIVTVAVIVSAVLLCSVSMGATGMTLLVVTLVCGVLAGGLFGGLTFYRTLFYIPSFTAGVATFILWRKLFNPHSGPINATLQPLLDKLTVLVNALPPSAVRAGLWVCFALMVLLLAWGSGKLRRQWSDGDLGTTSALVAAAFLGLPFVIAWCWSYTLEPSRLLVIAAALVLGRQIATAIFRGREFGSTLMNGFGGGLMLSLALMVALFILLGLGAVFHNLPAMASSEGGLGAPQWIYDYNWAKPSMMAIGFWAAIGSNTMLLYLAALTNVPPDLYEAADIDGAQRFARFWNITWPQLAPTTFFITVMAMIGGLQGGFEMARTMTNGGPAGATTTLSYFVYLEGFETGRLGYACAVAWALFILVFVVTCFNWTFGNRYVND